MTNQNFETLHTGNIVAFIGDIFKRRGAEEYIGEKVTMAEHMLQGAEFAELENAGDALVTAALLHDIGHFTSEFGANAADDDIDNLHEEAGARVLEGFFPSIVTDCVRYHVAAKRYLCATDPAYFEELSEASIVSLRLQGGPMSKEEVAIFNANPNAKEIVRVRIWDDMGKVEGKITPDFDHFAPMLQRVVDEYAKTKQ